VSTPGAATPEDLDALTTDELRRRAFSRAERHLDLHFFWDLLEHRPAVEGVAAEDGSAGGIAGGLTQAMEAVRELFARGLGDAEPLLRARFIDYQSRPE
jgi:hypothetical protein